MPVADWVKELTESIVGGTPFDIGELVTLPDGRQIKIVAGQFWGEDGVSNHWSWQEVLPGGTLAETVESGYGWSTEKSRSTIRSTDDIPMPSNDEQFEAGRLRAIMALCNKPAGVTAEEWLLMSKNGPEQSTGELLDFLAGYASVIQAVTPERPPQPQIGFPLNDVAEIRLNFGDADFWMPVKGPETGKPTQLFAPEHIGIKVTKPEILVPKFLYYLFEHQYNEGLFRSIPEDTGLTPEMLENIRFAPRQD